MSKESVKKLATIIKSLGHPARVEILILLKRKPKRKMTVTQIHEGLGLNQPETSRHLSILKNSNVLNSEKGGANSYYFINEEHSFIDCIASCISKYEDTKISEK